MRAMLIIVPMVLGGALCGAATQDNPQPKMVLSQESWDFGEVWHPESPKLTLVLRNEGNADLKINSVESTCGCTIVRAQRESIPPGDATNLHIRFDTKGKQREVESTIIINTNDPQRPTYYFRIKGFVKRVVNITPEGGLALRTLDGRPGQVMTARLENQTGQPLRLRLTGKTIPDLEVEVKEVNSGQSYDLVAWMTKELPPGIVRGSLQFSTGLEREETYSVPVRIQVLSLIEPAPPVLWVDPRASASNQRSQRWVNVVYYGTEEFAVRNVSCPHPEVEVAVTPPEPASAGMKLLKPPPTATMQLKVVLPPVSALPAGGTSIVIETNDPKCPKFEIPITTDRQLLEDKLKGPPEGPMVKIDDSPPPVRRAAPAGG